MSMNLEFWRQNGQGDSGHFDTHTLANVDEDSSFLEMLDQLNEELFAEGEEPVAFDSDCREGICGACGVTVDGRPHGAAENTPSCHQRLNGYTDGDTLRIEPLRATVFPVVRDLMVDRSSLDRVLEAGAHVWIPSGTAPDADATLQDHATAEVALDFAACIGCGACVNACLNLETCQGLTFNANARACFPKDGTMGAASPFAGALSGRVIPTQPERQQLARSRAEAASAFLSRNDLEDARLEARMMGSTHPPGDDADPVTRLGIRHTSHVPRCA